MQKKWDFFFPSGIRIKIKDQTNLEDNDGIEAGWFGDGRHFVLFADLLRLLLLLRWLRLLLLLHQRYLLRLRR